VNPLTFLLETGIELLSPSGTLQPVPYTELKAVCFVSDPGAFDLFTSHPLFERRPRYPGLWTRFTLLDGDRIDGVLNSNLADWPASGFLFTPPRTSSQRQRVFVPKAAVRLTELQGVIGSAPPRPRRPKPKPTDENQLQMFE
jgi:hypothetical protein